MAFGDASSSSKPPLEGFKNFSRNCPLSNVKNKQESLQPKSRCPNDKNANLDS